MSATPGTIELIAIELSKLLRPLQDELGTPGQAKAFLASMGFTLSDGQVGGLAAEITAVANDTGDLITIVRDLIQAIEDESLGTITTKAIAGVEKIADILNNIKPLSNQIGVHVGVSSSEVARRVFDFLLFKYLEGAQGLNDMLELAGLLDREDHNEESVDPNNPPFTTTTYHFDQIGNWFTNPATQIKTLYGWGNDNFTGKDLFTKIEHLVARSGLPVILDDSDAAVPLLDIVAFELRPKTDVTPHGLQVKLKNSLSSGRKRYRWVRTAHIELKIDAATPADMGLTGFAGTRRLRLTRRREAQSAAISLSS